MSAGAFAGIVLTYKCVRTGSMIRVFYIHLQQFLLIAIYQLVKPKMKGKYYKLKESFIVLYFYPDRDAAIDHIFSV